MKAAGESQWPHAWLWHVIGALLVTLVVDLSLTPHPIEIGIDQGDKLGHVLAYATLMFWYAQIYHDTRRRLVVAVAFVTMAIALEFAQRMTGYRSFEIMDMVAGSLGVLAGWMPAPPRSPSVLRYVEAHWPTRRRLSRACRR